MEQLHSPDRSARVEAKVREWIKANPEHRKAFERATDAREFSSNLPAPWPKADAVAGRKRKARPRLSVPVAVSLCVLVLAVMLGIFLARDESLSTGPGEQRTVELVDGTEVSLNANSRVRVSYDKRTRKVFLQAGEALFEVAKNPARPFVVVIGDHKIIALGTSFIVRRDEGSGDFPVRFAVTLVEGRVAVESITAPDTLPSEATAAAKLLKPGERLSFTGAAPEKLDSPSIDKLTAWRRGQLIFEDASLSEAAAEFNRYNSKKLVMEGAAGKRRVGGVFRIGDPSSFAQAMANMYHLRIIHRGQQIVLTDRVAD